MLIYSKAMRVAVESLRVLVKASVFLVVPQVLPEAVTVMKANRVLEDTVRLHSEAMRVFIEAVRVLSEAGGVLMPTEVLRVSIETVSIVEAVRAHAEAESASSGFLEINNILTPDQYGFRKSHSAVHPMVHLMNFISRACIKQRLFLALHFIHVYFSAL